MIRFEVMGHGKLDTSNEGVCNKEIGYLAAVKIITCLVLQYEGVLIIP